MYKKWLKIILVSALVFVSLLALIVFIKKDALKEKAIIGINEKLDAEITVDGAIDITFFKTFPNITLELNKVFIADKFQNTDTLANVEKINFTINPFSLIGDEISIKSIILNNGIVNLKTFKDGKSNFHILKQKAENNKGANLNLEEIIIHDIHLTYDDLKSKVFLKTEIITANFSGQFENKDFDMFIKLNTQTEILTVGNTSFLNKNKVVADFDLFYKAENKCISFKENEIDIEGNNFNVIGDICTKSNSINLQAKAKGTQLENALKLIPKDLFVLKGIKGKGEYNIYVNLTGQLNKPTINLNFELEDAKATLENIDLKITDLYTTGSFSNKPINHLVIKDFAFKSNDSHLKGNMIIPNLKEKRMELKVEGTVFSSSLKSFNIKNLDLHTGEINLKDVKFNFNYRKKDSLWIASKLLGEIAIDKVKGNLNQIDEDFFLDGKLNFVNRKVNIKNLKFNIGKNDMLFSGSLNNVLNYFQDNIFGTNDALIVNGKLQSNQFNINDFLKGKTHKKIGAKKEELNLLKWLNIESNVSVNVATLIYNKLKITDLTAIVKSEEAGLFSFKNLQAKSLGGSAKGNIELRFFNSKLLEVFIDTKLKKIAIQKLFKSLDNFGQTALTEKNIAGDLDADLILSMTFKNFKDLQKKDLLMNTRFVINDGELIKLASLKSLSKYLSIEQLEHIYFTKYNSVVSIANETISLRNSKIQSNLVSLELGGTHTFDNHIDYALKLNLKNLLATKFKQKKTIHADYVNNIMGGINIFLSMKGTVKNPIIKMDKQSAFKEQQKSLLQQKQDIKDLFKKDKTFFEDHSEFYFEKEDSINFINFEEE